MLQTPLLAIQELTVIKVPIKHIFPDAFSQVTVLSVSVDCTTQIWVSVLLKYVVQMVKICCQLPWSNCFHFYLSPISSKVPCEFSRSSLLLFTCGKLGTRKNLVRIWSILVSHYTLYTMYFSALLLSSSQA